MSNIKLSSIISQNTNKDKHKLERSRTKSAKKEEKKIKIIIQDLYIKTIVLSLNLK
jgi:hypothetical protein